MTIREESFRNYRERSLAKLKAREVKMRRPRSRRLRKVKMTTGTQPDGSRHPGLGLFRPHLLLGKNGAQTKRASVLIGKSPADWDTSDQARERAAMAITRLMAVTFLLAMRLSSKTFARAFMTTKMTSGCDGPHCFVISATYPVCCEKLFEPLFMQQA